MAPSWLEKFIVREDASPDLVRTSSSSKATLKLQYTSLSGRRRETPVRGAGYEPEMSSSQSQVFSRWSWVGRCGRTKGLRLEGGHSELLAQNRGLPSQLAFENHPITADLCRKQISSALYGTEVRRAVASAVKRTPLGFCRVFTPKLLLTESNEAPVNRAFRSSY
jgi:hypothetical protein